MCDRCPVRCHAEIRNTKQAQLTLQLEPPSMQRLLSIEHASMTWPVLWSVQDYVRILGRCLASLQAGADSVIEQRMHQLVWEAMRLRGQYLRLSPDAHKAAAAQHAAADKQRCSVPAHVLVSSRACMCDCAFAHSRCCNAVSLQRSMHASNNLQVVCAHQSFIFAEK